MVVWWGRPSVVFVEVARAMKLGYMQYFSFFSLFS